MDHLPPVYAPRTDRITEIRALRIFILQSQRQAEALGPGPANHEMMRCIDHLREANMWAAAALMEIGYSTEKVLPDEYTEDQVL